MALCATVSVLLDTKQLLLHIWVFLSVRALGHSDTWCPISLHPALVNHLVHSLALIMFPPTADNLCVSHVAITNCRTLILWIRSDSRSHWSRCGAVWVYYESTFRRKVTCSNRNRSTLFLARITSSTLKMEETRSSETSAYNKPTQRRIPEDGIVHSHSRENLKS
jgi:hypothetical protein